MDKKTWVLMALVLVSKCCIAHGFSGNGLLHPLTGLDHILAMVAVGAWSAQIGGKAIYLVPCSFLAVMNLRRDYRHRNYIYWPDRPADCSLSNTSWFGYLY